MNEGKKIQIVGLLEFIPLIFPEFRVLRDADKVSWIVLSCSSRIREQHVLEQPEKFEERKQNFQREKRLSSRVEQMNCFASKFSILTCFFSGCLFAIITVPSIAWTLRCACSGSTERTRSSARFCFAFLCLFSACAQQHATNCRYFFGSYTTVVSTESIGHFFDDCPDQRNAAIAARWAHMSTFCISITNSRTMFGTFHNVVTAMRNQIRQVDPSEDEFMALIGLAFWSFGQSPRDDQIIIGLGNCRKYWS